VFDFSIADGRAEFLGKPIRALIFKPSPAVWTCSQQSYPQKRWTSRLRPYLQGLSDRLKKF
jgi:hypothetical protein